MRTWARSRRANNDAGSNGHVVTMGKWGLVGMTHDSRISHWIGLNNQNSGRRDGSPMHECRNDVNHSGWSGATTSV